MKTKSNNKHINKAKIRLICCMLLASDDNKIFVVQNGMNTPQTGLHTLA